jgi:hypothetical protein
MPLQTRVDRLAAILAGLQTLENQRVLIGIPEDKSSREGDDGPSNAELAYIHEHGCVIQHPGGTRYITDAMVKKKGHWSVRTRFVGADFVGDVHLTKAHVITIPPRPFMAPGMDKCKNRLTRILRDGIGKTLGGDPMAAGAALSEAGQVAANAIQSIIGSSQLAPLAAATVRRRKKHSNAPLKDTGDLQRSITFIILKKGGSDATS